MLSQSQKLISGGFRMQFGKKKNNFFAYRSQYFFLCAPSMSMHLGAKCKSRKMSNWVASLQQAASFPLLYLTSSPFTIHKCRLCKQPFHSLFKWKVRSCYLLLANYSLAYIASKKNKSETKAAVQQVICMNEAIDKLFRINSFWIPALHNSRTSA